MTVWLRCPPVHRFKQPALIVTKILHRASDQPTPLAWRKRAIEINLIHINCFFFFFVLCVYLILFSYGGRQIQELCEFNNFFLILFRFFPVSLIIIFFWRSSIFKTSFSFYITLGWFRSCDRILYIRIYIFFCFNN